MGNEPPDFRPQTADWASWVAAPLGRALSAGEVHLWQLGTCELPTPAVAQLESTLSADERRRASRYHFEIDRRRFIVRRATLRSLLGDYLGTHAGAISFVVEPRGRPQVLSPPTGPTLHFSLSSSGDRALFAFARTPILGIDVEEIRDVAEWEGIAQAHFSVTEMLRLSRAPLAERTRTFLALWTRKEARLKASGLGLIDDLTSVDTLGSRTGSAPDGGGDGAGDTASDYLTFAPADGWIASLYVSPKPAAITWRLAR